VIRPDPITWVAELEMLGMRLGLERMHKVLEHLGHPERRPAIHIVGTNGKSSTTRMAAAILAEEGLRVGAYTSPHVSDWTERVSVDGDPIGLDELAEGLETTRRVADDLPEDEPITQFEALTAAAFVCFERAGAEVMVVEAGLGGRYDASNVLDEAIVVLTNIALEHTDLLGNTVAEIAAEKLAVAPDGCDRLVMGNLDADARKAVDTECARRSLTGWRLGRELGAKSTGTGLEVRSPNGTTASFHLPARAGFVRDNAVTAVGAVERLLGRPARERSLSRAFAHASLPGRLERLDRADGTTILLDGAHNPAGMAALAGVVPDVLPEGEPVAVVSVLGDKDAGAMMAALAPACNRLVATRSTHRRSASADYVAEHARRAGLEAESIEDPAAAVARALAIAKPGGRMLVCGSLYLLADVRPELVAAGAQTPATLARARGQAAGSP
jgi:dihydrofolate synthase/folylpolyglutamate synthase